MKPTKDAVLALLAEAREQSPRNHGWVQHSIAVGDAAGKIAAAVNQAALSQPTRKQQPAVNEAALSQTDPNEASDHPTVKPDPSAPQLDVDRVILMGYVHDLGKKVGPFPLHPYTGYHYLRKLGYDEDFCRISLTHSFVNNDPFCMFNEFIKSGRDDFIIDFIRHHHFTLEENLIALCDQMTKLSVTTVDKRMLDIMSRHGVCSHAPDRIREVYKLKQYFDDLLGYNLYDLFPEIKDNL